MKLRTVLLACIGLVVSPLSFSAANRRQILTAAGTTFATIIATPDSAFAGIDVSGLPLEGNDALNDLAREVRALDGSAAARVNSLSTTPTPAAALNPTSAPSPPSPLTSAASYTVCSQPLIKSQPFSTLTRLSTFVSNQQASFAFPSDWLRLDGATSHITFVDQRNGDKLYLFSARLPEGESLSTVNKSWLSKTLFDPQGDFAKYQAVEDPATLSATEGGPSRSAVLKYATVTANGLRVERRGLLKAFELPKGEVLMLLVGINAVAYKKKEGQVETASSIVESFRVD